MDPISPGFIGVVFSQSASNKKELKKPHLLSLVYKDG